jgi:hypothetical protein
MNTAQILSDLRAERNRISQAIAALELLESSVTPAMPAPAKAKSGVRRISAAGRKRISEAAKKRWAEARQAKANGARHMSPAARKRIADAMRKRWAVRKKMAKAA